MAAAIVTPRLPYVQGRIYRWAREVREFTDWELQVHFNDYSSTYRTRRQELVDRGLLRDTGYYRHHDGHKVPFTVWAVVD